MKRMGCFLFAIMLIGQFNLNRSVVKPPRGSSPETALNQGFI
jgi:hypothetical protein